MRNLQQLTIPKTIKKAKKAVKQGNISAAQQLYNEVLSRQPNHPVAIKGLRKLEKELSPNQCIQPQLASPSQDHINTLTSLYHSGQIKETEQECKELLQTFPQSLIVINILGAALKEQGKLQEAIQAFDKAIRLKPDYADAYYNRGNALNNLGLLEEAVKSYDKVIQLKPDFNVVYNNRGVVLSDLGLLEKAIKSYDKAIQLKPDFADAYYNRGNALKDIGLLEEAVRSYDKAIQFKPDYTDAYNNRGTALGDLGRLEEAVRSYEKVIQLKPDYAVAYGNLGVTLSDLGLLEEAIKNYKKAIQLKPDYAEAYNNCGNALRDIDQSEEAVRSYDKAIQIKPNYVEAYYNLSLLIKEYPISLSSENRTYYKELLLLLFNCNDIEHNSIVNLAISILLPQAQIYEIKTLIDSEKLILKENTIQLLLNEKLFQLILQKSIVNNNLLEALITKIRKEILFLFCSTDSDGLKKIQEFIFSLSEQCFFNEYVFHQTKEEIKFISQLKSTSEKTLRIKELELAVLGCYIPLNSIKFTVEKLLKYHSKNSLFNDLILLQVKEPFKEKELADSIISNGEILDKTSKKVKEQYEEHPYPRWRHTYCNIPQNIIHIINNSIKPNKISYSNKFSAPEVLIAGCGTGRQIIYSNNYKNAKILGVDLSLASLSYSKRKTDTLGMKNIDYLHTDILKLNQIGRKFNVIESSGVLHHMEDPLQGLKILVDLLEPYGVLKLGLYSELARKHIVEVRAFIKENKFKNTTKDIRRCRQAIMATKGNKTLQTISQTEDFYSISSVRDLIFHVQEHQFTLIQLSQILHDFQLEFLGFIGLNQLIKQNYSKEFIDDKSHTSLKYWHEFETKNPYTFTNMYQFWVRKK